MNNAILRHLADIKKSVCLMTSLSFRRPLWWLGSFLRIYRAHQLDRRINARQQSSQPAYDQLLRNEDLPHVQGTVKRAYREEKRGAERPHFHVWITGRPAGPAFGQTWKSLCRQTYTKWKVHCILDEAAGRKRLFKFSRGRLRIINRTGRFPHSTSTVCSPACHLFLEPGDTLPAYALEAYFLALTEPGRPAMVYGDHDTAEPASDLRQDPVLKPGWSPELLRAKPYPGPVAAVADRLLPSTWAGSSAREWTAEAALLAMKSSAYCRRIERCLTHLRPGSVATPASYGPLLEALGLQKTPSPASPDSQHRFSVLIPFWENRNNVFNTVEKLVATGGSFVEEVLVWNPADAPPRWVEKLQNLSVKIRCLRGRRNEILAAMVKAVKAPLVMTVEERVTPGVQDWGPMLARWFDIKGVSGCCPKMLFPDGRIASAGRGFGLDSLVGNWFIYQPSSASSLIADSSTVRNVSCLPAEIAVYKRDFLKRNLATAKQFPSDMVHPALAVAAHREGSRFVCDPAVEFVRPAATAEQSEPFPEHLKELSQAMEAAAIDQDPYMHRLLRAENGQVWMRNAGDPTPAMHIQRHSEAVRDIFSPKPPLRVDDSKAMADFFTASGFAEQLPVPDKKAAHESVNGAAMHLLGLLMQPDTRKKFPLALTEGKDGAFYSWATAAEGLTAAARKNMKEAFENRPGDQIRHIYRCRSDVRAHHPLGLTLAGQRRFAEWLFRFARPNEGICACHIWWFLLEMNESPSEGIAYTYLVSPRLQNEMPPTPALPLPRPETIGGWIDGNFGLNLNTRIRKPSATLLPHLHQHAAVSREEAARGVNLLGFFSFPSGLQQCADTCVQALRSIPRPFSMRDVIAWNYKAAATRPDTLDLNIHDTTVVMLPPLASHQAWFRRANLNVNRSHYLVAGWYWETEQIPENWVVDSLAYDEIWAPSRFVEKALKSRLDRPVKYMPPAHPVPQPSPKTFADFGLPEGPFTFYFTFDMCSCMERKNPLSLIRAFRLAFGDDPGVQLVIKLMRGSQYPEDTQRLRESASHCQQCRLLDYYLPYEDSVALMNSADCYCSLHRSEGLGLTMAEAMLLGKPVIATGYSGNLDFMNDGNSFLVPWNLSTVTRDDLPYAAGSTWAEPDVQSAADLMRRVREHPEHAAAIAERGRNDARMFFSVESYARRLDKRLEIIQKEHSTR